MTYSGSQLSLTESCENLTQFTTPFLILEDLFILLCWVFVVAHGLSLVTVSRLLAEVTSLAAEHGF